MRSISWKRLEVLSLKNVVIFRYLFPSFGSTIHSIYFFISICSEILIRYTIRSANSLEEAFPSPQASLFRGQSFSGHVVQAKMRVQRLFASVRHRGELTERDCGIYRDQARRGEYDIVSSLIVLKYFFFQSKRWRSGLSNALSPCPGCLKWLRYG